MEYKIRVCYHTTIDGKGYAKLNATYNGVAISIIPDADEGYYTYRATTMLHTNWEDVKKDVKAIVDKVIELISNKKDMELSTPTDETIEIE